MNPGAKAAALRRSIERISEVTPAFKASSHAELQAALAGLGIALLPLALTAVHLRSGELKQLLPDFGIDRGELHAVHASNRHVPASLRAFLDFVVEKSRGRQD
ncbi:LysR substrate-binding domain-containing protein [Neorhizobium sp. T25_13]|uniref:LysR substrate-binding domain-containing protein n=1 Tax=Neorhizobium sp. T25_13 TaxID=2093830 RepID=UPI000CF9A75A